MARIFGTVLFLTLFLCACSPSVLSPEAPLPTLAAGGPTEKATPVADEMLTAVLLPASTTEVIPPAKLIATLATPHIDQPPDGATTEPSYPQGCGYQWAYKDLPQLTNDFLISIRELQPEAQAVAFAFGEDCVHADGSATFIPMETDFNVTFPVADLSDESALGEWVVKVMQVIEEIPPERIIGPRPGRVSILFESSGDRGGVNFYIDQYRALPAGLSSAEIYRALQTP